MITYTLLGDQTRYTVDGKKKIPPYKVLLKGYTRVTQQSAKYLLLSSCFNRKQYVFQILLFQVFVGFPLQTALKHLQVDLQIPPGQPRTPPKMPPQNSLEMSLSRLLSDLSVHKEYEVFLSISGAFIQEVLKPTRALKSVVQAYFPEANMLRNMNN